MPGLDEVLGGGLPEFSFNLIAGPPGCGKTTLAHQIMFALATPERPALYFTVLGEPPLKMLRYQQQFDFFDPRDDQPLDPLHQPVGGHRWPATSTRCCAASSPRSRRTARRWSSSTRSARWCSRSETDGNPHNSLQQFVQQLGVLMTSWQATTFLIGEYFTETDANPVFTVADGLIWLRQSVQRNSMVRKMEIMKMRGQADAAGPAHLPHRRGRASRSSRPPALRCRAARSSAAAAVGPRLPMGVPGLDEMLGGGLPRGYSLLVAGPSGSGKSILAAAFLAEGARRGETGVIAAFEQRPNRSRSRALADLIESGRVGLVDSRAPDLSIDEIVHAAHRARSAGSRRAAWSSTRCRASSWRWRRPSATTSASRCRAWWPRWPATGVTVLMTSELEDRYTDLRFSPYGTAFLTDAIIVQRYIEVDSRLRRVMAVVKVRASAHSNELRAVHHRR